MRRRIAVVGAAGYIGTRLVPQLAAAGYDVRCLVRFPRTLHDHPWIGDAHVEVVRVDLDDMVHLETQLHGCEAAFYLVRSMEPAGRDGAARHRAMADRFATAAAHAGVQRIIHLGDLADDEDSGLSEHARTRRDIEYVLQSGRVPVTVFRAAMIVGPGATAFEILRYLTERLPVLITPKWTRTECQPIAIGNVLHYLVACLSVPDTAGRTLQIGGADVVTFERLFDVMADEGGLPRRIVVPVPVCTPLLSALWIHLVTPISARRARPLTESLRNRVIVEDDEAARLMPQELLTARESIRMALHAEGEVGVERPSPLPPVFTASDANAASSPEHAF